MEACLVRQITILVLSFFSLSAFAEFQGQILSYRQLMRLPSAKRAQYVKDVRALVLELEKQQLEKEKTFPKEYSAWIEDLKNFAGQFQVLPDASAKLSDGSEKKPIFVSPPRTVRLTPEVAVDAPSVTSETPNSSDPGGDPLREPITRGLEEDPEQPPAQKEMVPEETKATPETSASPSAPPAQSVTVKAFPETKPSCEIPQRLECESMSQSERNEGIKRFRADTKFSTCISGGSFSEYPGGRKVPGGCAIINSFAGKSCPGGQALCNPIIFGAMKYGAGNQPQNFQLVCVPRSSRGQFDITNRCGQCPMKQGWEKIKDPEDFVTLVNLGTQKETKLASDFMKSWNEMRRSLATNFKERCLEPGGKDFRAAFCQECKTVGHRVAEMNIAVLKTACAGNFDVTPNDRPIKTPSSESGDAKREPASHKAN